MTRQHDVGNLEDKYGHLGYIFYLVENKKLADFNFGQFYHTPLHHIFAAIFISFLKFLDFTIDRAIESIQYLTLFYSTMCIIVSQKIFEEVFKYKKTIFISFTLVALQPTFIILSGSINNDILSILFYLLTLLYLIKWYKNDSFKNICVMAICLALGMNSKVSIVMISPVIAVIFLYKLFKNFNDYKLYLKYILFGIISIPLGMWYLIRNLILFNQPFSYVLDLGIESDIYTGNIPFFKRFLYFPIKEFFRSPYAYPFDDYNIWAYIIKCFTFGEYSYHEKYIINQSWVLLFFSVLVMFISVFCLIILFKNYKLIKEKIYFIIVLLIHFVQIFSFIYFNIKYPFGCTMDTRYIVPMIVTGSFFIGQYFEININNNLNLKKIFLVIILCFAVSSIWMYTNII